MCRCRNVIPEFGSNRKAETERPNHGQLFQQNRIDVSHAAAISYQISRARRHACLLFYCQNAVVAGLFYFKISERDLYTTMHREHFSTTSLHVSDYILNIFHASFSVLASDGDFCCCFHGRQQKPKEL